MKEPRHLVVCPSPIPAPFIPLRRETRMRNGERGGPRGVERVFEARDTVARKLFLDESAIVPAAS